MGTGTLWELSSRRRAVTVTVSNWPLSALGLLVLATGAGSGGASLSAAWPRDQLALPASNRARGKRLSRREGCCKAKLNEFMGGSWSKNIHPVYSLKLFIYVFTDI